MSMGTTGPDLPAASAGGAPWHEVIDFWFGAPPVSTARAEWFRKDEAFDAEIRRRFGTRVEAALAGGHVEWDAETPGALAQHLPRRRTRVFR
jgi:uncharacterized protein (DUF924 family)